MRKSPTRTEQKMWQCLRRKKIYGVKFRRQQVIEGFIVDFFCHEAKLVIEIDGGIHDEMEQQLQDTRRRAVFEARGLKELRFRNDEILYDLTTCINTITAMVEQRIAST